MDDNNRMITIQRFILYSIGTAIHGTDSRDSKLLVTGLRYLLQNPWCGLDNRLGLNRQRKNTNIAY